MTVNNYKTYASLSTQISADTDARLLHADPKSIKIMRWEDTLLREFEFRFHKITQTYLKSLLKFGHGMARKGVSNYRNRIARVLQRLEPENFIMLKRIFLAYEDGDLEELCRKYLDENRYNDTTKRRPGNLNWFNCAALWPEEQIIIINLRWLEQIHGVDRYRSALSVCNMTEETFYTGLFTEIRRSYAETCPYQLSWLDDAQRTPKAIETWGIEKFNQLAEKIAYPWKEDA